MDLDKFRSQWDEAEFEQSFARLDQEPTSAIIERMKSMDGRAGRRRGTRQIMAKAILAALLGLVIVQHFVLDSPELPLQTAAFILELAVFFALQRLDKAREKYALPKLWLDHREFLLDEHRRIGLNIQFDQWNSVLLSIAILCPAMYAVPMLSAGLRIACCAVTAAAVLALLLYDLRRISQLKRSRDSLAAQLGDQSSN